MSKDDDATRWQGSSSVVGRARERERLVELLDDASGPRCVLLQGEAGIGKTWLFERLAEAAGERGMHVLQGSCHNVPDAGPLGPFLQILSQRGRSGEAAGSLRALRATSKAAVTPQASLGRRARALRRLSDLVYAASSETRTLLCLEDVHWADLPTLLVLNNLLDLRLENVTIVCTARPERELPVERRELWARIEQRAERFVLEGLTPDEVWELASGLLGPGQISRREAQELHRITSGVPLFLHELLAHVQRAGVQPAAVSRVITSRRLPARLAEVIDLRLAQLTQETRAVLSAAAVFGIEFSRAAVARTFGFAEQACEEALDAAVDAGTVHEISDHGAARYRFRHALYQLRLYERLAARERRRLHRMIADEGHARRLDLSVDQLAHHHERGFDLRPNRRASMYCRRAATRAEQALAYEDAAHYWRVALGFAKPGTRQAAQLSRRLGDTWWTAGRWSEAIEAWEQAYNAFQALGEDAAAGEIALALAEASRWRQDLPRCEQWLQRCAALLPAESPHGRRANALRGSASSLQDARAARQLLIDATKDAHDPSTAFWASQGFSAIGDYAQAHDVSKQAMSAARRARDKQLVALLAGNLIIAELTLLRPDDAAARLALVAETVEPLDVASRIRLLLCKALLLSYAGRWDEVAHACEEWMAEARLAAPYQLATARIIWGESLAALGNLPGAQETMEDALPDLALTRPLAAMHLARLHCHAGRTDEAAALVRQHAPEILTSPRLATARAPLGDVAASLDDADRWEECYAALAAEDRRMLVGFCCLSRDRVLGRLATRLRRWTAAAEHFESAVDALSRGRAQWELGLAMRAYAQMWRLRGRRGDLQRAETWDAQATATVGAVGAKAAPGVRRTSATPFVLTGREREVLNLVAMGLRNREIAQTLTISDRTVERHLENIFGKMGAESRTEAVVLGIEAGLVGDEAESASDSRTA